MIRQILGQSGDRVRENLADISPDLATFVLEVIYGGVYQDTALDPATRQLVTVAALAAQGHAQPQLATHIAGALHCGCSQAQVVATLLQVAVFAGVPAALNGIDTARTVFARVAAQASP